MAKARGDDRSRQSSKAFDHPEIAQRISTEEYRDVVRAAEKAGLVNLDVRGSWWLR
ncbi:hypothetical protein [Desulfobotulus mexicanus]|uniref:hypothetical protein n=1 Tax=Desulfobotulus mexicanus TaxID=2586642 RepID=UPI0015D22FA1|nr:hypothetical protein [Desulfobotulus mexicanus]